MAGSAQRVRHRRIAGLVALALGLSCNPSPPPDEATRSGTPSATGLDAWVEHTSKACGFAIRMPPSLSAQPTPPGLLDQLAVDDAQLQMALIASCGDVPSVSSPRQFLEVTSSVIARQLHATVEQRTDLLLSGRRGLELVMTIAADDRPPGIFWPGDLVYRLRLYVSGRRQYQLHAVHAAGALVDDLEAHFFAGFSLLDSAPPPLAALTWSRHTIAGITVEAPGQARALPRDPDTPERIEAVRFGEAERSTPYALSVWMPSDPSPPDKPRDQLQSHFERWIATPQTQIIEQTLHQIDGHPTLEIRYQPRTPLPSHIAPDTETRTAVQNLLEGAPPESRVRLVSQGLRIIELRVSNPSADDDPERFFGSVEISQ